MNYKTLTIIALALCLCVAVPVSAASLWSAGNYVQDEKYAGCDSVRYDPQTDVYSCYKDVNPVSDIANSPEAVTGTVKFIIRAGYSTLSEKVTISNLLAPNETIDVIINPDGFREYELAAGNFSATLDNFNLPDETQEFVIVPGKITYVAFIGQAVSTPVESKVSPEPTQCQQHTEYRYYIVSGYYHHGHWVDTSHWSNWDDHKPMFWNLLPDCMKDTRVVCDDEHGGGHHR